MYIFLTEQLKRLSTKLHRRWWWFRN